MVTILRKSEGTQSGERFADNLGAQGRDTQTGALGFGQQKGGQKYCWYRKQSRCSLKMKKSMVSRVKRRMVPKWSWRDSRGWLTRASWAMAYIWTWFSGIGKSVRGCLQESGMIIFFEKVIFRWREKWKETRVETGNQLRDYYSRPGDRWIWLVLESVGRNWRQVTKSRDV